MTSNPVGSTTTPLLSTELLASEPIGGTITVSIEEGQLIATSTTSEDGSTIFEPGIVIEPEEPGPDEPGLPTTVGDVSAQSGAVESATISTVVPEPTIVDIVAASGGDFDTNSRDFDLLFNAVQAAGLADALADANADLTVFAPTDAAFVKLAQDLGYGGSDEAGAFDAIVSTLTELGGGDPIPVLTDVLLYHVSPEGKRLGEIKALDTVETLLDGATFAPKGNKLVDNDPDLANPGFKPSLTDIRAQNGSMIQGINRVLIPLDLPGATPDSIAPTEPPAEPTIADIVAASGGTFDSNQKDFDLLLTALQTAGLVDALADPDANLTVFAPTDAAFVKLAQDLGYEGSDEAGAFGAIVSTLTDLGGGDPVPVLTDVLLYHVSPEGRRLSEIQELDTIDTLLEGATITPKGNKLVDNEPDLANPGFKPSLTGIRAQNGSMIQGINRVLIPLDLDNEAIALAAESGLG